MLINTSCRAQVDNKINNEKMKHFDIEKFEKNKGKQGYYNEYHYSLNNKKIREFSYYKENEIKYKREISQLFHPVHYIYVYDKEGNISTEIEEFNNSIISIKQYNSLGKIINEEKYNNYFNYGFQQIREIVLKEKGVDIYDQRQAMVNRVEGDETTRILKKYYQVHILKSELLNGEWYSVPAESFFIDDETGEILTEETIKEKISSTSYRTYN
ncbi:hypothetical protein Q787_08400 [Ornithobacterium rhinotracheale H06-030791]|nr:hypothetical protein Q785_08585 [Ornithobacterium rhinotracheale ORT-UMN 88]KGB66208.1 hypothetical protein Q787_08400 [Ornithobacterium rhinotracheale H06-030791]